MHSGNAFIAARYANAGAEVIAIKQKEYAQAMAAKVFNSAYDADDYDTLETLATRYKGILPSEIVSKYGKIVNAQRRENEEIKLVQNLYAKFNGDLSTALKYIDTANEQHNTDSAGIVRAMAEQEGIPYVLGGDGITSTDCGESIRRALNKAGVQWESRYVPYMIDEAEAKKVWKSKNSGYKAKAGDLVVVNGDEHIVMIGDDGGVWQAGVSKGKVYHSPTSVEDMFGAENITGYIAISDLGVTGSSKIMSIKDKERQKDKLISYFGKQKSLINMKKSEQIKSGEQAMFEAYNSGIKDFATLTGLAKQYAGDDLDVFKNLSSDANFLANYENNINAKNREKITQEMLWSIEEQIDSGSFQDRTQLKTFLRSIGIPLDKAHTFLNYYDKKISGANDFEGYYDWQSMKNSFKSEFGNDADFRWKGSYNAAKRFITTYTQENGKYPNANEVYQELTGAAIIPDKQLSGYTTWQDAGIGTFELDNMGVIHVEDKGAGHVLLVYKNGSSEVSTIDELQKAVKNFRLNQ